MPVLPYIAAAVDLVLPRACVGCGAVRTWWCASCESSVRRRDSRHRAVLPPAPPAPSAAPAASQVVCWSAAPYRGPAGAAVVALKERGAVAALPVLAALLADVVLLAADEVAGPDGLAVVPAPSRPSAVRARGSDVLAELARAACRRVERERSVVVVPCLVHARRVVDQAGLDAAGRISNLAGALAVRSVAAPLLSGRTVVVVDDVVTTGSTLGEACRAVRSAVPGAAVVAASVTTALDRADPLAPVGADG